MFKVIIHENFGKFSSPMGLHPSRTLPANHRAPNHYWFSTRIARCIAVIGGTGGVPSWWGWGRVPVCVRAVWRGGLQHAAVTSGWRLASSPNSAVLARRGQRRLLGRLASSTPCLRRAYDRVSAGSDRFPNMSGPVCVFSTFIAAVVLGHSLDLSTPFPSTGAGCTGGLGAH